MAKARDIRVHEYREILVWPFRLEGGSGSLDPTQLRTGAKTILEADGWREIANPLHHLLEEGAKPGIGEYQEYVYFYPFVRDFLYGAKGASDAIALMNRPDIKGAWAEFALDENHTFAVTFRVERLNMYLFEAGIAVLALELVNEKGEIEGGDSSRPMTLRHAQIIQERLRRAYPPFWISREAPGLFPRRLRWLDAAGAIVGDEHSAPDRDATVGATWERDEPPPAGHWVELLRPLLPDDRRKLHLRQVVDERIPLMLYLRVDDAAAIERGDWVRLAMCDDPGDAPLPYGKEFLTDFEALHCYDRHWITDDMGSVVTPVASRYLFSGYGFVAVGGEDNWFFKNILPDHFRRHYFQLALLAHFEASFLLGELSQMKERNSDGGRKSLSKIMNFTEKYWFTTFSSQKQSSEMLKFWRSHLDTNVLYKLALNKARDINQLANSIEDRQAAAATNRLTVAALLVAIPSLATGFLGMNVLVDESSGPPLMSSLLDGLGWINQDEFPYRQKNWGYGGWVTILWAAAGAAGLIGAFVGMSKYLEAYPKYDLFSRMRLIILSILLLAGFVLMMPMPDNSPKQPPKIHLDAK